MDSPKYDNLIAHLKLCKAINKQIGAITKKVSSESQESSKGAQSSHSSADTQISDLVEQSRYDIED